MTFGGDRWRQVLPGEGRALERAGDKYLPVDLGIDVHVPAREGANARRSAVLPRPDFDDTMLTKHRLSDRHIHPGCPSRLKIRKDDSYPFSKRIDVDQQSAACVGD